MGYLKSRPCAGFFYWILFIFDKNTSMQIRLLCLLLSLTIGTTRAQIQCENDSTGNIPLVDLKTGYYLGVYQGGLYPNGKNVIPNSHLKKGLKIVKGIKPLDTLGNVNYETGKIILAGFGGSTTGEPFNHLITIATGDPDINPCLKLLNATNSGEGMESMNIDHPEYWDYIEENRLNAKGYTREQVQIAWLFNGSRADTIFDMPAYRDSIEKKVQLAIAAMLIEYPNLKHVYVGSPYYAGYADPTYEMYKSIHEPGSYRCGFGFKAAVEKQIMGDPLYKFTAPGKVAPFISWGPYLWADGITPRDYDSLYWDCEVDFRADGGGFHLNGFGKDKLAYILHDFFTTDTLSEIWYNDGPKWASCGEAKFADDNNDELEEINLNNFNLYPSVNNGTFNIEFPDFSTNYSITIHNNVGSVVYTTSSINTDELVVNMSNIPNGLYFCRLFDGNKSIVLEFVVNK